MSTILQAFAPLAALYVMHMVLKATGLGSLTKMTGSIGLATQAAVKASGDPNWSKKTGAMFDKAGSKFGLRAGYGTKTKAEERALKRKEIRRSALKAAAGVGLGALAGGAGVGGAIKAAGVGALDVHESLNKIEGTRRLHSLRNLADAGKAGHNKRRKDAMSIGPESSMGEISRKTPRMKRLGGGYGADPHKVGEDTGARRAGIEAELRSLPLGDQRRDEIRMAAAREDLDLATAATWGADWIGRTIPEQALLAAQYETAQALGIDQDSVLMSMYGLPPQIRPGAYSTTSVDQAAESLSSFRHYLDPVFAAQRPEESDEQYTARLYHTGVAMGAIDRETGQEVNWLLKNGIDTSTDAGREEVAKFINGQLSAIGSIPRMSVTAGTQAYLNSVSRTLDVELATSTAEETLTRNYDDQRVMVELDRTRLDVATGTAAAAVATASAAFQNIVTSLESGYEAPATTAKIIMNAEQQLGAIRSSVDEAMRQRVMVQVEADILRHTDEGNAAALTDDAIAQLEQQYLAAARTEAQQTHAALDQAFGDLVKNSKTLKDGALHIDQAKVTKLVGDITSALGSLQQGLTDQAATAHQSAADQIAALAYSTRSRIEAAARTVTVPSRPQNSSTLFEFRDQFPA